MATITITSQGIAQPIEWDSNWLAVSEFGLIAMEPGDGFERPYHLFSWGTIVRVDGPSLEMTQIGLGPRD